MAPTAKLIESSIEESTPMNDLQPKSYTRAPSNLTLPLANLESISRTTTAAGTPLAPEDPQTPSSAHPFSAFYSHPQCAVSSEAKPRQSTSKDSAKVSPTWDRDVEAAIPPPPSAILGDNLMPSLSARPSFDPSLHTTQTQTSSYPPSKLQKSVSDGDKDQSYCTVWPLGSEVRQRKEKARRMKGCLLFRNLSRKQKILAKVLLGLLILGIATIIGVVISYKTGGLVWKSANQYGAIGT